MPESKITVKAENQASEVLNTISDDLGRLADSGQRVSTLSTIAAGVTAGFVAIKGAIAAARAAAESLDFVSESFTDYQNAIRGLNDQEIAFTKTVEQMTGMLDTQSAALLKLSRNLGVASESQDDAVLAAKGLSETLGIGVDQALRRVSDLLTGNARALDGLVPSLKQFTHEENQLAQAKDKTGNATKLANIQAERQKAIQDLVTSGLEISREKMSELEGAQIRQEIASRNLGRTIGEFLVPVQVGLHNALQALKQFISSSLISTMKELWANYGAGIQATLSLVTASEAWHLWLVNIQLAATEASLQVRELWAAMTGSDQSDALAAGVDRLRELANQELDIGRKLADRLNNQKPFSLDEFFKSFEPVIPDIPEIELKIPDLDKLKDIPDKLNIDSPDLQAVESRLLVLGPGRQSFEEQTAENTEQLVKVTKEVMQLHHGSIDLLQRIDNKLGSQQPDQSSALEVVIVQ